MNSQSMDVFSLRDTIVHEYRQFARSFTSIRDADIRAQVEAIYAQDRYWPEPLLQLNPNYQPGKSVEELVAAKLLHPRCAEIFRVPGNIPGAHAQPLRLHAHQDHSVALAKTGASFVVTTGTGSGKSLCFFLPLVSAVLEARDSGGPRRTQAIIIYPMNALANSQLEEIRKFVNQVDGAPPISVARYTGQEKDEERQKVAADPPDILLTNFMMLELLMTRQDALDRTVIANCAGLRFLVLDELHTYRGRQGADVAMLVRRVRERLAPTSLQCIGTSATMASEGSLHDKARIVAGVASRLFGVPVDESNVVAEKIQRATLNDLTIEKVQHALGQSIDAGIAPTLSDKALQAHPLAVWVETTLGIAWSDLDQRWVRAKPKTLTEAVAALAEASGRSLAACDKALRDLLLVSSVPETQRTGDPGASARSFFAFKLHQFISGAGYAYATLEPPGERTVTVEGQQFLPGAPHKRLYALHFCRDCGHAYHPVRRVVGDGAEGVRFYARDIDDSVPDADEDEGNTRERFGFLTLHGEGMSFDGDPSSYPDAWVQTNKKGVTTLKPPYRNAAVERVRVKPDGSVGTGAEAWFLPGRFRLCLRCGETWPGAGRDRNRLASLSAEGRSSATTVLVGSALRWMHGPHSHLDADKRKVLGFTDNRQDAALQAGHFNDFLFVSLVRAGFLRALQIAGDEGLSSDKLGEAQEKALGFDKALPALRSEWLLDPDARGANLLDAHTTLREVLSYRVWFDQRRGWRFTNPNLEQLGLLSVRYEGLDALAADEALFANSHNILRTASPEVRKKVFVKLFDHMRQGLAVHSKMLDREPLEQIAQRSYSALRAPWGFASDERPRASRWLMVQAPGKADASLRDEELFVRGGARSALGRTLRKPKLWGTSAILDLKGAELVTLLETLLAAAKAHKLVLVEPTPFENAKGYKLVDRVVRFGLGTPETGANPFFVDYYGNLAGMLGHETHPLFTFEAREHTAQVEQEKRLLREKRFRWGSAERAELESPQAEPRTTHEPSRFLPVLFCSPTMELGVDISALNTVYMRNVPPTPANYAQRSGRAGRSGQAALVLTYCSAQGPHDQYFFREPKGMVHGEVHAPLIDLANRDLIDSHLQAVWLACSTEALDGSIARLLDLKHSARPLLPTVRDPLAQPAVAQQACTRIARVLALVDDELGPQQAPWYTDRASYADSIVAACLDRFDRAFHRWRELFAAAEAQRDAARRTMDDYAAPAQERKSAQARHAQAMEQLSLLQQDSRSNASGSSDFYTYRYLATEGFLPGYNFPRLPLMAFIPTTQDRRGKQTFLQRPRFLALSEFGPRSLVYHEGRAFRVVRAMLSQSQHDGANAEVKLVTQRVRVCRACGAGHFDDAPSVCHACGAPLADAERIENLYRIENVATQAAERITANDEERQRQGFDLQTTFEWAVREHTVDVRRGEARDADGTVATLAYGVGATITRINKGLRRRADRTQLGYWLDPLSGYWAKGSDENNEGPQDPTSKARQLIVPMVRDQKNALLVQHPGSAPEAVTSATLQHALLRGIEAVFQLEEGEVLAEPMPDRTDRRGFLVYEATEGGAGVLSRLVAEPHQLAAVARMALSIMHFAVDESGPLPTHPDALAEQPDTRCVAGCYRCLLSYYNQPDHELIDRRNAAALELLLRLARASVGGADATPATDSPEAPGDPASRWHEALAARGLPAPDTKPRTVVGITLDRVWRSHYVAATTAPVDEALVAELDDQGWSLVVFDPDEASWPAAFDRLAEALGRSA